MFAQGFLLLRFGLVLLCACLGVVYPSLGQVRKAYELSRKAYDIARTNPDTSIEIATEALKLAKEAKSTQEEARAHAVLGRSMILKSDILGLRSEVALGLALLDKVNNDTIKSDIHNLAALNYRFSHQPDSALYALGLAEKFARKGKMTTQLTNVLTAKGALLSDKRKYGEALNAYEECYRIDTHKKDEVGQALDLQNIGLTLSHLRLNEAALKAFQKAIPIQKQQNDRHGLIRSLISITGVFSVLGLHDSADRGLSQAYALAQELGDYVAQGAIANNMSTYAYDRGLREQTRLWARRSIKHYTDAGDSVRSASSLANLGDVERTEGNLPEAQRLLEKAIAYARILKEEKVISQATKMLAHVYHAQGNYSQAAELYRQYGTLQDTLFKKNIAEEVATIEARHETFLKDQEISLLNKNLELQRLSNREQALLVAQKDLQLERGTLMGVVVVLVLLGGIGLVYFFAKRKELKVEAEYQRSLVEEQAKRHTATLTAEEAERKRIARDLHDGVGQMIASIRLHMAARATPAANFTDLEEMLSETSDEVRFISHNLMPQALERKGFDAAVEEFCDRIIRTKKLQLNPCIEPVGSFLAPQEAQMLYRVMQELVSNVLKHAKAKNLYITLAKEEDTVALTVEDDGQGFDSRTLDKEGIGLGNLADRVQTLGGRLDIDSHPGRGSVFTVHFPVETSVTARQDQLVAAHV